MRQEFTTSMSLDDQVKKLEEERRKEDEKRRREEAKRRQQEEARRQQEERKRRSVEKRERENMFPKDANDGIMKPNKPRFSSIEEIKDAQVAQRKLIDDLGDEQWDHITRGTDDMKIISGQKVDKAKQELLELDYELTDAYGLGPNGYLSKPKSYGTPADEVVHTIGQQPMTPSQNTALPTTKNTSYTPPKNNFEADDWVMHGKQPTPKPKPKPSVSTVKPYDPNASKSLGYYSTDRDDISKGAQRQKELQINQKLDEIVNGQDLSDTKKYKLQDDLRTLNAEKNVILWKQQNPNATSDDFDAKRRYFDDQINKASDDYVNTYGGKDDEESKEAWSDYSEQVHGLVAQRDAFNRMEMGVDTTAVQGGGDDWDIPENIDTPEEMLSEQAEESNLSEDEGSNILSDIMDTVSYAGEWVVDKITGGLKWVEDNAEAIMEAQEAKREAEEAEKKEQMDSLGGDYAEIAPALDSLLQVLNEEESGDVKDHVVSSFEDMLNGKDFDTLLLALDGTLQNAVMGNDVHVTDFDNNDIRTEMEVLTHGTVNTYNSGVTLDGLVGDMVGLIIPSDDSDSSGISGDLILHAIDEIVASIIEQNDPGKILLDGDVRISIQDFEQAGDKKYTHYFFRGTELLYSINTFSGDIVYGEHYETILGETLQESINQFLE